MNKLKKFTVLGMTILLIGAMSVTAFATSYGTPAEIVAGLTGKSVDSVIEDKAASGKTYGTIAGEAGKLPEFKSEILQLKKAVLEQKVADGTLTREKADEIIAAMEENQANCDGTGLGGCGQGMGAGFGGGQGFGQGRGRGMCAGNIN